jgi:AsmA protein
MMKKILYGIAITIVLVVIAVFAAIWLIDWNSYVAKAVREATGRELRIGTSSLSVIPSIQLSATDVSLSNAPGAATPQMFHVGSITANVKLWPLITRRVLVDTFVVTEPSIFLEVDKAGRKNWVFKEAETKAAEPPEEVAKGGTGLPINDLHLGDVRIEKGLFSYVDAKTGQKVEAKDVNLKISLAKLDSILSLTSQMTLNGKPVKAEFSVNSPANVLSGKRSGVKLELSSAPVSTRYEGSIQGQPVPGLDGVFALDIPSVGQLASWLNRPLNQRDPGPLKVHATFLADGAKVALKEARIEGKALQARASGSFDGTGQVKKFMFNVESGVLDIDRYLPPVPVGGEKAPQRDGKKPDSKDIIAALSTDPLDLSGLRQLEGNGEINIAGVRVTGFNVGRLVLTTKANNGILATDLSRLELYDGIVTGKFKFDVSGEALNMDSAVTVDRVQVGKLLQATTREKPPLTGVASGTLVAATHGPSPRALAENLSGKLDFSLGGGDIKDARAGAISQAKVNLVFPGLEGPPSLQGSMIYNKELVNLDITLDTLKKILSGERFATKVVVSSKPVNAQYNGYVQQKPVPGLDGKFNVNVPSAARLAAWLGQPLSQPDPGPLQAQATLTANGEEVALKEAVIEGKALKAKATGSFRGNQPVVVLTANVDVERMDLNAYLPPSKKKETGAEQKAAANKDGEEKPKGWSEEPFDLSLLSNKKTDVQIKVASIRYQDLVIQQGRMAAVLDRGVLKTSIDELKLAEGTVAATVRLDTSDKSADLDYTVLVKGVEARPLLKVFAGTDRLSGKMEFQTKGQAKGRSQKELVETLNGNGQFKFLNGAIHGINLAATLRRAKSLGFGASEAEKTDFAELSGSFVIKNGVLENRDLKMLAPLVRLSGEGIVPMPPQTIDYNVEAKLVPSLEGQGGQQDALVGLPIPIRVRGPWHKIEYSADWKSVFSMAAKDPARLKNMPANLRQMGENLGVTMPIPKVPGSEKLGDVFENIPGLSKGKGTPESSKLAPAGEETKKEKKPPTNPLDSIKGLFGK